MHFKEKVNGRPLSEQLGMEERFTVPKSLPKEQAITILFDCQKQQPKPKKPKKPKKELRRTASGKSKRKNSCLRLTKTLHKTSEQAICPLQKFDEAVIYSSKPDKQNKDRKKRPIDVTEYHFVQEGVERIIPVNTRDLHTEMHNNLSDEHSTDKTDSKPSDTSVRAYELQLPKASTFNGNPYSRVLQKHSFDRAYVDEPHKMIDCHVTKKFCHNQLNEHAAQCRFNTMLPERNQQPMRQRCLEDKENVAPWLRKTTAMHLLPTQRQNNKNECQLQLREHMESERPQSAETAPQKASRCTLEDASDSDSRSNAKQQLSLNKPLKPVGSQAASLFGHALACDPEQRHAEKAKNLKYRNFIHKLAVQLNSVRNALKHMQRKLFDNYGECDTLSTLLEQYRYQRSMLHNLKKLEIAIDAIQEKGSSVKSEILQFRKSIELSNAGLRSMYFENMRNFEGVEL